MSLRIGLPVWGLLILVQLFRQPVGNGIAMLSTVVVVAAASWLFLHESEIVVDGESIAKRSLLGFWRRAPLAEVGGIAFRNIGIKHVGIVYRKDRRCVFWITADVWDQAGLRSLVQLLGGDHVERAAGYSDINREFPGTFPRWLAFYERHPFWTIALSTIAVFALIIVGLMVGDLVTVGHSRT